MMDKPYPPDDVAFLKGVIRGSIGHTDPLVEGRLEILRIQYIGEGGMQVIVRLAIEAHARNRVEAGTRADAEYLVRIINGSAEFILSQDVFPKLSPLFAKYAADARMLGLLDEAAEAFSHAVVDAASWRIAHLAIDLARRRAGGQGA